MKILFVIGATARIRNFQQTLTMLADRGHDIRLTGRLRKGTFELPPTVDHPRITGRVNPTQRVDEWGEWVDLLRGARDYVRYFDPRYAQATRLVRRAYEIAPTEFVLFCERHAWVKRHWKAAARVLALCEELIPSDPGFEAFLRDERPDLLLVTPLVTFEAYQTDYVKAAHRLGIPVVFIPFSWDNLTNKGLMRVRPDRVIVWNDVQRREAIDLHGCAPGTMTVTGAARFDEFFARTPSTSREAFFTRFGLDPSRPMVLYLGSSQLTGPNEMELVRRWAESLRASDDEVLRSCGILVRPHPAVRLSWESVDLSDLGAIGVSLEASRDSDQQLFDSIYHAHVAVGLNTSAMLEAAIVGRPVHTLLVPGFDEGQVGTIHFHYLVEAYGGLATIARGFPEHHRQLAAVLRGDPALSAKSRAFAQQFLRPHGIDNPVSPILAAEIERAAGIVKRPSVESSHHPWLRRALHGWLRRRRGVTRAAVDATVIGTSLSLRPVKTALEELQQGGAPVFVGPWGDSIAHELLYWIPFVRWVTETYGLPPERLIVLTGGLREWYGSIAHRFLNVRTLFSEAERQHWERRTVPQSEQDPKQAVMSPFDGEIVGRAARAFDLSEHQVLHPFLLFRLLRRLDRDRALDRLPEVLRHARLEAAPPPGTGRAPSVLAVSTAFTPSLPATPDNEEFLTRLMAGASATSDVIHVDGLPLRQQAETLAGARAFIGGYGDLAILAAFCGTPATVYHTTRLPLDHADRLEAAAAAGWGRVRFERTHRFKGVRLLEKAHA